MGKADEPVPRWMSLELLAALRRKELDRRERIRRETLEQVIETLVREAYI